MGFYNAGLSPSDFTIVRQLQPEIIGTLRNAAAKVGKGLGQPECIKWFGDDSDLWSAEVQEKLNLLAGMVNVKQIAVSFSRMDGRCGKELAEAMLSIAGLPAAVVGTNPMTTGETGISGSSSIMPRGIVRRYIARSSGLLPVNSKY